MTEGWLDAAVNLSEVRERLAQAWDEGWRRTRDFRDNPYRAIVGADEDNLVRGEE